MRLDFSNIGKGLSSVAEAYTEKKRREQLAALGPSAEAVAGTGYEVIDPQGQVTRGLATPDFDLGAAQQAYEQSGYQLRPLEGPGLGQQYAARAGSRDVGTFGSEAAAEQAARRYDVGLTRQRADIYEQTGDKELAERLRQIAASEGRAVTAEERAARGFETGETLKGLQIGEAEAKAAERTNLTKFNSALAAAAQADPNFVNDPQRVFNLATQSGLTPGQIRTVTADMTGVKEDTLRFVDADTKSKFKSAKDLNGVLALDKDDTTYNPGRHHVRRATKDGFVLDLVDDNTGAVISSSQPFKNDAAAMEYLYTQATSPWTQAAVARQLEAAELDKRSKESTIGLNVARAGALGRGGSNDAARLSQASNILGRQLQDIETRLADKMLGLTPAAKNALTAERNKKAADLRAINQQLVTALGVSSPAAPPPQLKAGDIVTVGGESREYVDGPVNDPRSYKAVTAATPKRTGKGLSREAPAGPAAAEFEALKPAPNTQTMNGITYESTLPSFRVGDRRIDPETGRAVTFSEFVELQRQRRNTNR